jgi:hypothetical protein
MILFNNVWLTIVATDYVRKVYLCADVRNVCDTSFDVLYEIQM